MENKAPAEILHADPQTTRGNPGGNRRGWLAREVERVNERGPAEPVPGVLRPVLGVEPADGERGDRGRGRQKEIVLLEEWADRVPERELPPARLDVLHHAVAETVFDARDQAGIHAVAPPGKVLRVDAGL